MDKKAKKILLSTFWSAGGWKSGGVILTGEDFEYARSQGLMFDPVETSHDELIAKITALHQSLTKEQVCEAFLHSLSSRKTHLRSALSSFALTKSLPLHTYNQKQAEHIRTSSCHDCNEQGLQTHEDYTQTDLNVLNFERIKWGGIRLNWLIYCWMDLDQFSKEAPISATEEDVHILQKMLDEVRACAPQDSARKLEQRWKDVFPSSKHERDVVMEVLGYAGVLVQQDQPRLGRMSDNDFRSMDGWQGQDGYAAEAVADYFGKWGII